MTVAAAGLGRLTFPDIWKYRHPGHAIGGFTAGIWRLSDSNAHRPCRGEPYARGWALPTRLRKSPSAIFIRRASDNHTYRTAPYRQTADAAIRASPGPCSTI